MGPVEHWNLNSLAQHLASCQEAVTGAFSIEYVPGQDRDGAISLSMHEYGDLGIVVGVSEHEIQASVILNPVTDVPKPELFQKALLKGNKLLTLSTFGITEVAGVEHYEIFGQLSARSSAGEIMEEIDMLARNAIQAAEMIAEWTALAANAA